MIQDFPDGSSLAVRLADWVDWDVAEWHLAIVLGLWNDQGDPPGEGHKEGEFSDGWKGHKGIIWSSNPIGDALAETLITLHNAGVLDYDEEGQRYRWARK